MSQKVAKVAEKMAKETKNKYVCECCHYTCYKIYNYTQHLLTAKHKKNTICQKVAEVAKKYACECYYTKHLIQIIFTFKNKLN